MKLGDTVTATYGARTAMATVPVEKVVKLHINILRDKRMAEGDTPTVTVAQAEAQVTRANEIYAPVGIKFTATIQVVDPPAGVDLSNGLDEFPGLDAAGRARVTAEEKALLGDAALRNPARDDIEVYFVNSLRRPGGAPGSLAESFGASLVPDAKYVDSIVSARPTDYQTLAHEIGHVLMDSGDHPDGNTGVNKVNLMAVPYELLDRVTDSRRITVAQARDMLSKRRNLLSNPYANATRRQGGEGGLRAFSAVALCPSDGAVRDTAFAPIARIQAEVKS